MGGRSTNSERAGRPVCRLTSCVMTADEYRTMLKRRARIQRAKNPRPAAEQPGLSEQMRQLIDLSTAEDRRNLSVQNRAGDVGKRRRRTDETSDETER
jgi:hypothetical protein